jgi:hypothetical protein
MDSTEIRRLVRDWKELDLCSYQGSTRRVPRPVREAVKALPEKSERLPTHLHSSLDEAIGGGLRRGELAVIVAPSKHGKTSSLLRTAAGLSAGGYRVLYISFEIYLEQIIERLVSLCGKKRALPKTLYAEWLDGRTSTVDTVIEIAQEVPDLDCLMLDYVELMNLDSLDLVNAVGDALLELRSFAKKNNLIVWSASQSDEPRPFEVYLKRDEIYGSRRKIHHADLVIGTLSIPQRRQLTYSIWGSRHGVMGMKFMSEADLVNLKFRDL